MFKKKKLELLAVCDGKISPLSSINDEAFASGMLGVGYALSPTSNIFRSPVSGIVENVADTRHAYTIVGETGEEVLIHIGIDTVSLGGDCFESKVTSGVRVFAGEPIARVDLDRLKNKGFDPSCAVIVTNSDILKSHTVNSGMAIGGKTVAFVGKM